MDTNDDTPSVQATDRLAIQAALHGNWEEAIRLNTQIVENNSENTSALNRLGIAYLKTGQLQNAKRAFQKVLEIDQFNSIARANIKRVTPKFSKEFETSTPLSNHTFSFIEESGKSKVIPLANIGEPHIIANLYTGLECSLKPAGRKVKVTAADGQYIGSLPDDISIHLIKLMKAGNRYQTLIKSADTNTVQVFIRELKRSKKVESVPSFSTANLDDLETSSGNQPSQPPLEIYDPVEETSL